MRVTMLRYALVWLSAKPVTRTWPSVRSVSAPQPLNSALVVFGVFLALLGKPVAGGMIVLVVAVKATLTCFLRARAERTLAALELSSTSRTQLVRTADRLVRRIAVALFALAAAIALIGLLRGQLAAFLPAAGAVVVVAGLPLGLPAAMTDMLAAGAARMTRRNIVVRRLSAVEAIGGTTVICAGKTGSFTENQMTVTTVVADGRTYETTGVGYSPDGEIVIAGAAVSLGENIALDECLAAGLACNDSRLVDDDGRWRVVGDPTEGALLTSATKMGLEKAFPRVDTLPFAADRRFMATLHRLRDEPGVIYVKGSVERVLYRCHTQLDAAGRVRELDGNGIRAATRAFGRRGLRVVALAYTQVPPQTGELAERTLPPLIYLGLQAMHDPVRPQATDAVQACRDAGIQVKMITGDEALAACATAAWVGLDGDGLMTGAELRVRPAETLPDTVAGAAVFARISGAERVLLVQALQSRRHVVAMTGRSDDDLPALRQADIGIDIRPRDNEPGYPGRDNAQLEDTRPIWRAADLALADGDFASIVDAVEEGRRTLAAVTTYVEWALPITLAPGLVLAAASLSGTAAPITPVQVLWLSLIAVLLLRLSLAPSLVAGPAPDDIMRRPAPTRTLFDPRRTARVCVVLLVLTGGAFGLFHWELGHGVPLAEAHTATVAALALMMAGLAGGRVVTWTAGAVATLALITLLLAFSYVPMLNDLFGSAPLTAGSWVGAIAVALAGFVAAPLSRGPSSAAGDAERRGR